MGNMSAAITQRDFRNFQARYHRNGISGQSFVVCAFWFVPAECYLRAVVFDNSGYVAVTNPQTIDEKWCGDDFEPALRRAIAAVEANQPESLHA